jgi:hypothetical protein
MTDRYYVRIERTTDDGSRTYKGPWTFAHCEREARAWWTDMPDYDTVIVPATEARADFKAWSRAVRNGGRYYPQTNTLVHDCGNAASCHCGA